MLAEGTRRFDLYDFFSILIPGAAFLIGLAPLFPLEVPVVSTSGVVILLVGGFVVGRCIHAAALRIERFKDVTGHREHFVDELVGSNTVTDDLADRFYDQCLKSFEQISLPQDREGLEKNEHEANLETLYALVRSYIHMDARGRSRTFQAVLDFYRSIWVASALLSAIYVFYAFLLWWGIPSPASVGYTTYMSQLGIHYTIIFFGAVFVLGSAYATFKNVRSKYREFFIQYLMSDFVVLRTEDDTATGSDAR
jgi:hypothetical protein